MDHICNTLGPLQPLTLCDRATEIREICALLEKTWQKYPYQRLGQLIWNLAGRDPYSVADERWAAVMGASEVNRPGLVRSTKL